MCTTAVAAMATSVGKKSKNAGSNNVPNPNPEKKLRKAPANATTMTRRNSTGANVFERQRFQLSVEDSSDCNNPYNYQNTRQNNKTKMRFDW